MDIDFNEFKDIEEEVKNAIKNAESLDEKYFEKLALKAFEFQFHGIPEYSALCRSKGIDPASISSWKEIPPVPSSAFKHFDLFVPVHEVIQIFTTSGTTGGEKKGKSHFSKSGLSLMDTSISVNARKMLFPEGRTTRLFILVPPPEIAPHMIISYGMNRLKEEFGIEGSQFFIDQHGLKMDLLLTSLKKTAQEGIPVTIIGASFGFVSLFDCLEKEGIFFKLPPLSRAMDAGGYKGKSREISKVEFLSSIEKYFGIPQNFSVNLLGMTELASQFYDNVIAKKNIEREKVNAPWTKTLVLDPESLIPLPSGQTGILQHFDLANIERPLAILSDDLGVAKVGGFEIIGRAKEEAKGCSISVEEMIIQGKS